jgi:hypothetical protein
MQFEQALFNMESHQDLSNTALKHIVSIEVSVVKAENIKQVRSILNPY